MAVDYYEAEPATASERKTKSVLIPKSLIGDTSVGGTITLRVLHVFGDEVEVGPQSAKPTPSQPNPPPPDRMPQSPDEPLDYLA